MPQIVAEFDPASATSGTFSPNLSNGIGKIIIWNESNWTLDIKFTAGDIDLAPAWTATIFELEGPAGKLTWMQDTQLAANIPPISKVWVVAYRDNETIPGVFPVALVRQTNIGNAVTLMASATSVQNDGNVAGTSLLEATVAADISSAVTWSNDAILVNGNAAHPGTVSFDNATITSDGAGRLTLGHLFFSGAGGLSRTMKAGPFTVTTVLTAFNHGLGATPDFVIPVIQTGSTSPHNVYVDYATMDGTTVKMQGDGTLTVYILSLKF
jgi:hypothetical protein